MEPEKFKEIGADTLPQLLKRANEIGIKKEQYIDIIQLHGTYHMIYVSRH